MVAVLALVLAFSSGVSAKVVGRLTQVEGRVDLLKGGKLPATPVKVGDRVDAGDVLRSKSLSRAQITFIDSSVINLSPQSRLAIEEYRFEPDQGKRWAVLELFYGLAHVVVNKIFKVEEPDFIIKTHTAVTGVRGTDFGVRLYPNASTILNFEGVTRVGNIFPEVHAWERRAPKIAFQPPGGGSFFVPGGFVDLNAMQGTTVQSNLPPTLPFAITSQDRQQFMNQVATGLLRQPGGTGGGVTGGGAAGTPLVSETGPGSSSLALTTGTGNTAVTLLNTVTVPPLVVPTSAPSTGGSTPSPSPSPTPSTFSFTQQYYAAWITSGGSSSNLYAYSWGQRSGVIDGYFNSYTQANASSSVTGRGVGTGTSVIATANGTVTGFPGQTLAGTMNFSTTDGVVNRTGTVTILPSGQLTYDWTNTTPGAIATSGTTNQTPGTYFTQTATGTYQLTSGAFGTNQAIITDQTPLTVSGNLMPESSTLSVATAVFNSPNTFPTTDTGTIELDSKGVVSNAAGGATSGNMATITTISGGAVPTTTLTSIGVVYGTADRMDGGGNCNDPATGSFGSTLLVQVGATSGLTTASVQQTSSGSVNLAVNPTGDAVTTTTPPSTPLTGTMIVSGPGSSPVPSNTAINLTATTTPPTTLPPLPATAQITQSQYGVVAGPPGGPLEGQAGSITSMTASPPSPVALPVLAPAAGPTTLTGSGPTQQITTNVNVIGSSSPSIPPVQVTGTVTTTPAPPPAP